MRAKNLWPWLAILVLILLEQGIKLFIFHYHFDTNVPILSPLLYFSPMFNRDYSWFNSMFQLGLGKWFHIVIVFALLVVDRKSVV